MVRLKPLERMFFKVYTLYLWNNFLTEIHVILFIIYNLVVLRRVICSKCVLWSNQRLQRVYIVHTTYLKNFLYNLLILIFHTTYLKNNCFQFIDIHDGNGVYFG